MKKTAAFIIALVMIFSFCACTKEGDLGQQTQIDSQGVKEYSTVNPFDFSDFKKENKDKAVTEGFKNAEKSKCIDKGDAKKLAMNELSDGFEYNEIKINFDRTEGIWRVSFSSSDTGKTEHICVDSDGLTQLIVKE